MNPDLRKAILTYLTSNPKSDLVISGLESDASQEGSITYNPASVWVDPLAPGFTGTKTAIGDEELVRAYLLARLVSHYDYPASPDVIRVEKVYAPVGRPTGKGGRVDVLVQRKVQGAGSTEPYLFIECKAPDKFDDDLKYIDGQLFLLSRQEQPRPRYLIYYTVQNQGNQLAERIILIDTSTYPSYQDWDRAGQPITDVLPIRFSTPVKRRYANVDSESVLQKPLSRETKAETFSRLRTEMHDVIWGGGGTNNNEVFVYITKLILAKIYDEQETLPGQNYRFQRLGDAVQPETAVALSDRMNELYKEAEEAYLALPQVSLGPAFDRSRISAEKLAFVVGRLESVSITENAHQGDLLGEFFEQIVEQDFTQSKGQFFTPTKIVKFMLELAEVVKRADHTMMTDRDHLGRPRLPFVIDPSCGSGTFLIEYMKEIKRTLGTSEVEQRLPPRGREAHRGWFGGVSGNRWARDFLFGVENNYDLGAAAKVNMVLHGDGSMNTWIESGLLPFQGYWIEGRNNVLGTSQVADGHPYAGIRNEQFDLILSNPPFSVTMSQDEKQRTSSAFVAMSPERSESLFIERWYQLLRDGGLFCCVLPEAVLDTSSNESTRLFLLKHFKMLAVVSLPYVSFKPFTSTKTCIVLAQKRSREEVAKWDSCWTETKSANRGLDTTGIAAIVVGALGLEREKIFMAEPESVGYKRRKNLPDLHTRNDLYPETGDGDVADLNLSAPRSVLEQYFAGPGQPPSSTLGFWTDLGAVAARKALRMDAKYRWFWDVRGGLAFGDGSNSVAVGDLLEVVRLDKVSKGELEEEMTLIDLEAVETRQALLSPEIQSVDVIGSDKVRFQGCELAIAKLEPYLGKILLDPPQDGIGSTEWVGLRRKTDIPAVVLAYLLMLPAMCESYRRLQSGKRHARFDTSEFLSIRLSLPPVERLRELHDEITAIRGSILSLRSQELKVRRDIDALFIDAAACV